MVNFQKSSIVFSKSTRTASIEEVKVHLPMEVVDRHEKYLGLPSVIGRSKREVFSNIRDNVCHKLQGWKEKWLSKGGKEILIKAVIQAIPSYAMGCFRLPTYFTSELESLMAKFWWESTSGRGIHWTKWKKLCTSKQVGGLGFRDLESFNTALLAKQLWRLLVNSESLLSKILKAKYYPNTDVLGATLGSNPSYTWRCIYGAKHLLEAGLRWRVGNGTKISVWADKWLPRESTFQPTTPRGNHSINMKVCELLNPVLSQWDEGRIKDIFNDYDARYILSIPLTNSINPDRRIWHYNKNGIFSVRSAYHLAVKIALENQNAAESSTSSSSTGEWKWLWKVNLPTKIKIFVWRACKDFLPTRTNLAKRKMTDIDRCVFCNNEAEDVLHCLAWCCFSRQVWAVSNIPWSTYGCSENTVFDWFRKMQSKSDVPTFERCVLLCWVIWHCRNKFIFEGTVPSAMDLVNFVQNYWSKFKEATTRVLNSEISSTRSTTRWQPPNANSVKINFDASVNLELGVCGLGVVARSATGDCIAWSSICVRQPFDPLTAEAKAALYAVEFACTHPWESIIIEGDSSVVIGAIKESSESCADYGNIISDLKALAGTFRQFRAQHVGREGNRVAHEIARLSYVASYSSNVLPCSISNIVSSELV